MLSLNHTKDSMVIFCDVHNRAMYAKLVIQLENDKNIMRSYKNLYCLKYFVQL